MRLAHLARRIIRKFTAPAKASVRRFRPQVEALDRRDVPATWWWVDTSGDHSGTNAYNWDANPSDPDNPVYGVPAADDSLFFGTSTRPDGSPVGSATDCVGLQPLYYTGLSLGSNYTGTVYADDGTSAGMAQVAGPGRLSVDGAFAASTLYEIGGATTVDGAAAI